MGTPLASVSGSHDKRGDEGLSARADLERQLSGLSHALANVLHGVSAASEFAATLIREHDVDEAATTLERVDGECMRAVRLLRDGCRFIAFEGCGESLPVDVAALIESCARALPGPVQVQVAADVPTVAGDAAALRRMLIEVLRNAFQFGAHQVQVTLARCAQAKTPMVAIRVRDDGAGIGFASLRLFDPFVGTDPARHSGLGLALAARVATAHAGFITAEDVPQGALFSILLPAWSEDGTA